MKMTNVFVGTSGTAIFETASLQTPSILFESSQNQKTDVFSLEKIGHYFYLNLDLNHIKCISFFEIQMGTLKKNFCIN